MKQLTVTAALRKVLKQLQIEIPKRKYGRAVYSDARKQGVGVKIVGVKVNEQQGKLIQQRMEELGFVHVYTKLNSWGWGNNGTRFCYKQQTTKPKSTNQVMKDMRPISMKCSQKQFNQIKPVLEENGLTIVSIDSFTDHPYLVNNLGNDFGEVSNAMPHNKDSWDREVFEEWDQDLFLQYCGIETKPKYIPTAMKCTMEQFQSIQPILLDHGKQIHQITNDFHYRSYLINHHESGITNLHERSYYIDEAKVRCETWDGDLFLKNCGIEVTKQKEHINKVYTRSIEDMMKIHYIACSAWKTIILDEYIRKVNPHDGMIEVTEEQIDQMFTAATPKQVPVLEEVFGKQKKEIDWDKIKTGSKVMIKHTGEHCSGIDSIETSEPVDVVFWKTPHCITGTGVFRAAGYNESYCTFHQNGKYVLFTSYESTDYVAEVIEY